MTEKLKQIHNEIKMYLDVGDFNGLKNYLNQYKDSNDVNVLRTILIVIKTFRNNEIIKDIYNILLDNFNKVSKSKY